MISTTYVDRRTVVAFASAPSRGPIAPTTAVQVKYKTGTTACWLTGQLDGASFPAEGLRDSSSSGAMKIIAAVGRAV
jgi:hypothetical protein